MGLENSRRFRALPVYAVLLAYGRQGFSEIFARQVRLAREIAAFIDTNDGYELLPKDGCPIEATYIVVLFRAKDDKINRGLTKKINDTRKIYVSGTKWDGKPACRFAISTWRVDVARDLKLIQEVLTMALEHSG